MDTQTLHQRAALRSLSMRRNAVSDALHDKASQLADLDAYCDHMARQLGEYEPWPTWKQIASLSLMAVMVIGGLVMAYHYNTLPPELMRALAGGLK